MKRTHVTIMLALAGTLALAGWCHDAIAAAYRSPLDVVASPDGGKLYVSDKTARSVIFLDAVGAKVLGEVPLPGEPHGLALAADGGTLYVAERSAHAVALIDTGQATVAGRIDVGFWPVAVAIDEVRGRLYTSNRGDHTVSVVDLAQRKEIKRVPLVREPCSLAVTPDGATLVVTNLLPLGPGTDPQLAAEVTLVDAAAMTEKARIKLPPGSTVVRSVCISPDGKWAYVIHTLGRFNLPITQLERGWVHTYALSIIDVPAASLLATTLLDDLSGGAADPWDIVSSADGRRLWISHSGTHEVSLVYVGHVHELLEGNVPEELAKLSDGPRPNIWVRISQDRGVIPKLADDLTALYIAGAIRRVSTGGIGPRGLALSPDGKRLYAANHFSGTISVLDAATGDSLQNIPLGLQPEPDAARRGEIYFHDARHCFQNWHSCATCHPDARVDGLPWDFMRDGIGNGKDVISMVYTHHTSPHNWRATRADPRQCMETGVVGSHLIVPEPSDVDDLLAYVESLQPEANPNLPQLSEASNRGKVVFEGKADCAKCHPAPYFTDQQMHNLA
ncbi:MAG: hypothetical protein ABIK89_09045, partial [Planctomycetota bacterium]